MKYIAIAFFGTLAAGILWFMPASPLKTILSIDQTINCKETIAAEDVLYDRTVENDAFRKMCFFEGKSRITISTPEGITDINCREQIKILHEWHDVWVLAEICERLDVKTGTITLR